jgi:hypothetical protein
MGLSIIVHTPKFPTKSKQDTEQVELRGDASDGGIAFSKRTTSLQFQQFRRD